jgi:protoporphyrinogen oxidase
VRDIAAGLQYRDFINVGILLKQFSASTKNAGYKRLELKDNWRVGPDTTWIRMEYFCNKTDAFWAESDETIQQQAIKELQQMDLARPEDVLDGTVKRMEKTYLAYFGTFNEFDQIRAYTDCFEKLFLVGRNGMHKYNNADHSMQRGRKYVAGGLPQITAAYQPVYAFG